MSTMLLPWGRGLDQRQRRGKVTATLSWTRERRTRPTRQGRSHPPAFAVPGLLMNLLGPRGGERMGQGDPTVGAGDEADTGLVEQRAHLGGDDFGEVSQ